MAVRAGCGGHTCHPSTTWSRQGGQEFKAILEMLSQKPENLGAGEGEMVPGLKSAYCSQSSLSSTYMRQLTIACSSRGSEASHPLSPHSHPTPHNSWHSTYCEHTSVSGRLCSSFLKGQQVPYHLSDSSRPR